MAERLRVTTRAITYPVGASLDLVRERGGLSKVTREEWAGVVLVTRAPGEWCDDVPSESLSHLLEAGKVEWVTVEDD